MSQRILLIESDTGFAQEVRHGFEGLGATVEVAGDGPSGLDAAQRERPDLILLSVELPAMNGFLVCKKFKKDDSLREIPLMILSSESSDETFENHRKLKIHAEEYLHKPVAFAQLAERAGQLVPLNGHGDSGPDGDLMMMADDDMIFIESDLPPSASTAPSSDVELFADRAVADMLERPSEPAPARHSEPPSAHAKPEPKSPMISTAPAARKSQPPRAVQAELTEARERIASLDRQLKDAEASATREASARGRAEERAQQAESARADASRKGGASSREMLGLREQLNQKDRELLTLRDDVTARDRRVVETEERALRLERQLADLSEQQEASERSQEEASLKIADLEATIKELSAKLSAQDREHAEMQSTAAARHAGELEALREQHEEDAARHTQEAQAQLQSALQEAGAEAERSRETALEGLRSELTEAHQAELARIGRALSDVESKRDALDGEVNQLTERLASFESLSSQLGQERDEARASLEGLQKRQQRDAALLERVKKALTIGTSLLEEQQRDPD